MSRLGPSVADRRKAENAPKPATPVDLKELGDGRADKKRRERLEYLFEQHVLPLKEEQDFWREQFRANPALLVRHGAFLIKGKTKVLRFKPDSIQCEVLDFLEECWKKGICADVRILKGRQVHMSTIIELYMVATWMAVGSSYNLIVGNETAVSIKMLAIQRTAIKGLPEWLKITFVRMNDKGHEVDDPESGVEGVQVQIATARKNEDVSVGDPAQFRHYTEVDLWWAQGEAFATLSGAEVWEFPAWQVMESTGRNKESGFHNSWKYGNTPRRDRPGLKSFFFPWFRCGDYVLPLPKGVAQEEFWAMMDPIDRVKFQSHGCSAEQANWYIHKRDSQLASRVPLERFMREFPFTPEEAFLGRGGSVFDVERLKVMRILADCWKSGMLAEIPRFAAPGWPDIWMPPEGHQPKFARCNLVPANPADRFSPCRLSDASLTGNWYVFEEPRAGHGYVIPVDIAEGKENESADPDSTVIGVWRYTYDKRADAPLLVQVAQYVSEVMSPEDAAEEACRAARHWRCLANPGVPGRPAKIIFERNNNGRAFENKVREWRGFRLYEHWVIDRGARRFVEYGIQVTAGGNSQRAKNVLVGQMREALRGGIMRINSKIGVEQASIYTRDAKGMFGAPPNEHDDCVSESYLALAGIEQENRGVLEPVPVIADGDVNLAFQPEEEEIEEALLGAVHMALMKEMKSKSSGRPRGVPKRGV